MLLLQMLQGPWPEMSAAAGSQHQHCCMVAAETAAALSRLGTATTLPMLLQNSDDATSYWVHIGLLFFKIDSY